MGTAHFRGSEEKEKQLRCLGRSSQKGERHSSRVCAGSQRKKVLQDVHHNNVMNPAKRSAKDRSTL